MNLNQNTKDSIENIASITDPTIKWIRFDLGLGKITDNGATPWTANIALGNPEQIQKYMIDTGTTNSWVTSTKCTTDACMHHNRFKPDDKNLIGDSIYFDFGSWGRMKANLYHDVISLNQVTSEAKLLEDMKIYIALDYSGQQFYDLACDGGLAIPAIMPRTDSCDALLTLLFENKKISWPIASFWSDVNSGQGGCLFGAVDFSKFKIDTINSIEFETYKLSPEMWTVNLDSFKCGDETVLSNIQFGLDTGSSWFKGDGGYIQKLLNKITKNWTLPETIYCDSSEPDLSKYSDITLTICGYDYLITPKQYFMNVSPGEWTLPFKCMTDCPDYLLVGSIFLDTVYSIFEYDETGKNAKRIILASRA